MKKTIFVMLFGIMLTTANVLAEDNSDDFYFPEGMTWRTTIYPIANGCDRFIDECVVQGQTVINGMAYQNIKYISIL